MLGGVVQHGLAVRVDAKAVTPGEEPEAGVGLEGQATEGGGDKDNTARIGVFFWARTKVLVEGGADGICVVMVCLRSRSDSIPKLEMVSLLTRTSKGPNSAPRVLAVARMLSSDVMARIRGRTGSPFAWKGAAASLSASGDGREDDVVVWLLSGKLLDNLQANTLVGASDENNGVRTLSSIWLTPKF